MSSFKLISWSNNFEKNVEVHLSTNYPTTINFGNQNSYSDCFLPLSNIALSNKDLTKKFQINKVNSNQKLSDFVSSSGTFLYGIPGKSNVTIAGALAADTHGKDNTWGGSFSKNVKSIELITANNKLIKCDENKNADIFETTIGGYGLTGTINKIFLKKNNIPSSNIMNKKIEKNFGINTLLNSFEDKEFQYWVGWINLLSGKYEWVVEKSNFVTNTEDQDLNFEYNEFKKLYFSYFGKNKFKLMSFVNFLYFATSKNNKKKEVLFSDSFFPISKITDTRNLSPKRKIIQVQFSIPKKNEGFLEELIEKLIFKQIPLLCSIKRITGQTLKNNFSFMQDGWTVAVDFSQSYFDMQSYNNFLKELIGLEGKIYLAKDVLLTENQFKTMYPDFKIWEDIVKKIDPYNKFQSLLSKRLGLKKW